MRNMANAVNCLDDINALAILDSAKLIANADASYRNVLDQLAADFTNGQSCCRVVMLAGPSGSGKTTTAHMLAEAIQNCGRNAFVVSLDNFYRGVGKAPRLEDGSYDYESVEALDYERLQENLIQLLDEGRAYFPIYDFETGSPADHSNLIELGKEDIIILEGIHALNPIVIGALKDKGCLIRLYISVETPYVDAKGDVVLTARDTRLLRRMLRDYRFRNADLSRTFSMWKQVCRGEDLYLFPYKDHSDIIVDSFHCFEPCVYRELMMPLVQQMNVTDPHYGKAVSLMDALSRFEKISVELVPQSSMIREFTGGGKYL